MRPVDINQKPSSPGPNQYVIPGALSKIAYSIASKTAPESPSLKQGPGPAKYLNFKTGQNWTKGALIGK